MILRCWIRSRVLPSDCSFGRRPIIEWSDSSSLGSILCLAVLLGESRGSTCSGVVVWCVQQGCLPQIEITLTQHTARGIAFWLLVAASYINCTWRLRLSASLLSPVKVYFIKNLIPQSGLRIHANLWMWHNWNKKACIGWGRAPGTQGGPGPGQPCACRPADSPPCSLLGLVLLGAVLQPDDWEWVDSLQHPVLCPASACLSLISFRLLTWGAKHSCGCWDGSAALIQLLALGLPLRYTYTYRCLWELIQIHSHSSTWISKPCLWHPASDLSRSPS